MIYYIIRHKATGKIMPLMRRGKGYSHWNPGNPNANKVTAETEIPRLFLNKRNAERCIGQWFSMPNAEWRGRTSYYGEDDYDVYPSEPDGRKKEDLEILAVSLEVELI